MAKDANTEPSDSSNVADAPQEVTPEQLAAAEPAPQPTPAPTAPVASKQPKKGLIIGGSIAAGALVLGLSFGGGYALGHANGDDGHFGPDGDFSQGAPGFDQGYGQGSDRGSGSNGSRPQPPSGGFRGGPDQDQSESGSTGSNPNQTTPST